MEVVAIDRAILTATLLEDHQQCALFFVAYIDECSHLDDEVKRGQ